jgi:HK97 family phage major capsid protein
LDLAEQRALSRASGPSGNFLAPSDLEAQIIGAARAASAIGRLAREFITDSGATLALPVASAHGGATWAAENAATSPSDETFGEVQLGAGKISTKLIASEELAADARVDFAAHLAEELGRRLGAVEGAAFATGSGTGQAQGLVNAVPVVVAATGSTMVYKLVDLLAVFKSLPAPYRSRATWLLSADDFGSLAALQDTAGSLVLPALQNAEPSLLGRPVEVDAYLPAPAANARSAVFADFQSAYVIRRVSGISVQRLEELHSDSGQLGFRAVERVDGRVMLGDAARVLQHSAT